MRRDLLIHAGGSSFRVGDDDDHLSYLSMVEALEGDTRRLDARRQSGAALSQNEKDFLAGKIKRVRNKPPKRSTRSLHFKIARLVHYCRQGKSSKAAVAEAERTFNVSRKTVFGAVKEVKCEPGRQMLLEEIMRDEVFSEARLAEFKAGLQCRGGEASVTWSKDLG